MGFNCATLIGQTGPGLEAECGPLAEFGSLVGPGLDAECGPLIGQIGLSLDTDWSNSNPS